MRFEFGSATDERERRRPNRAAREPDPEGAEHLAQATAGRVVSARENGPYLIQRTSPRASASHCATRSTALAAARDRDNWRSALCAAADEVAARGASSAASGCVGVARGPPRARARRSSARLARRDERVDVERVESRRGAAALERDAATRSATRSRRRASAARAPAAAAAARRRRRRRGGAPATSDGERAAVDFGRADFARMAAARGSTPSVMAATSRRQPELTSSKLTREMALRRPRRAQRLWLLAVLIGRLRDANAHVSMLGEWGRAHFQSDARRRR